MAVRDDERREALKDFYEKLSPEERRSRVVLKPAFRDAYNELTQAHRQVPVPAYFWEKWAGVLGPVASMLYMRLRQYCYYNAETGERRDRCWPKQETLGKEIGVSKRTVMRTLPELEKHGFIRRDPQYRMGKHGAPNRATDVYQVYFEIPLTPEDAVELLLRETESKAASGGEARGWIPPGAPIGSDSLYGGQIGTHRGEPVDNSLYEGQSVTHKAVPDCHRRTSTRTNTPNVSNVEKSQSSRKKSSRLRDHPTVRSMTEAERSSREALAWEVGDALSTMAGDRGTSEHKSHGFHLRVCHLMPEQLVREALISTRDAIEEQRSGRKSLREGPAGYFAGAIRAIEEREGLDLGVKWRGAAPKVELRAQSTVRAPHEPPPARKAVEETHESDEFVPMPDATREALRAILGEGKF